MRWREVTPTLIESDAGYRVMRCVENGLARDWFVAFHIVGNERTVLGGYPSGADARAACEAHHSQRMLGVAA